MEDSRWVIPGKISRPEGDHGLVPVSRHRAEVVVAREEVVPLPSRATDPHCPEHAHFTPICETCQRARAAFLPYNVIGKAEPPSRSFQQTGSELVTTEAQLGGVFVEESAAEIVVDWIIGSLPPLI